MAGNGEHNAPEVLKKFYPGGFHGYDLDGRPVFIEPLGRIDFQGILNSATTDDVLEFKKQYAREMDYRCRLQEEKLGKTFKKRGVLLLDAEGGNVNHLWKPGLAMYNDVVKMLQDDFPDVHHLVIIINTPFIFPIIWGFIKPFLNAEAKERTAILGRNWKSQLSKYIDEENLPVHFGGKCRDQNGSDKCEQYICYGGNVPKSFYIENLKGMYKKYEGFEHFELKPGDFHHVSREASSKCTSFKYSFTSCAHDVLFSVFIENNGQLECVLKETEYAKHQLHEESIVCRKKGVYLFQFCLKEDLKYSDKVFYSITEKLNDI